MAVTDHVDAPVGPSSAVRREARPTEPIVTVAVPMLNESRYILACLDSFAVQDYPLDLLDVMVIDGGSEDGCRLVVEAYADRHPWVRIVDNPIEFQDEFMPPIVAVLDLLDAADTRAAAEALRVVS